MRNLFVAAAAACLSAAVTVGVIVFRLLAVLARFVSRPLAVAAAVAIALVMLQPSLVLAQTAAGTASTVPSYTVDLTQIVTLALTTVGTILAALAAAWVSKLTSSAGLKLDDQQRAALEQGGEAVANMMIGKIKGGSLTIATKSQAVSTFANLLIQHFPDALAYFGLDDEPAKLANFVEARLEKWGVMPTVVEANAAAAAPAAATTPAVAAAPAA